MTDCSAQTLTTATGIGHDHNYARSEVQVQQVQLSTSAVSAEENCQQSPPSKRSVVWALVKGPDGSSQRTLAIRAGVTDKAANNPATASLGPPSSPTSIDNLASAVGLHRHKPQGRHRHPALMGPLVATTIHQPSESP